MEVVRMRIGVVSTYNWLLQWDNYGSLLQIYALQAFLEKDGHDAYLIRTVDASDESEVKRYSPVRRLFSAVTRPRDMARRFKTARDKKDRRHRISEFNRRHPRGFQDFMSRNIAMSEREYTSEELIQDPPPADVYVSGSDQVWAVASASNFLGFGDRRVRRLAYAVSRPWPKESEKWRNEAGRAIGAFDAVSVRELEGIEVCRQLGRDDAVHVVDPVLLLERDDYAELVEREGVPQPFQRPFVLAYLVNVDELAKVPWKEMQELGRHAKGDLKVVPLQGPELLIPEECLYVPRPAEWINAFAKCASVVTTSYHGMLFAILMQKPFLVVLQAGGFSAENCRFMSVLNRLGLEDRIYRGRESSMTRQMHAPIDWEAVESELSAFKDESTCFLREHLAPREATHQTSRDR